METEYITTAQLAERWGFSPQTIRNWRTQGLGPAYLVRGRRNVLYPLKNVIDYEEKHEGLKI